MFVYYELILGIPELNKVTGCVDMRRSSIIFCANDDESALKEVDRRMGIYSAHHLLRHKGIEYYRREFSLARRERYEGEQIEREVWIRLYETSRLVLQAG